jgi:hypothetical protein
LTNTLRPSVAIAGTSAVGSILANSANVAKNGERIRSRKSDALILRSMSMSVVMR